MDLTQLTLQPVFATALVTYRALRPAELGYDRGDLIQVQKDLGGGLVYGANVSQGSVCGTVVLRNIELNVQTQMLEATQLAAEELLMARRELLEIMRVRAAMQLEVSLLRDEREELKANVNPIRYAIRSMEDLILHLLQTDIECIEAAELVREAQNEWTSIVADINRLQSSVDDPELDPFRRLVLDRCDGLKKRVAALVGPATDTITSTKLLHVDLENVGNAAQGRPLIARPSRSASEHSRTSSQGSLGSISAHTATSPGSSRIHIVPSSPSSPAPFSSPNLYASTGSLPDFSPHSPALSNPISLSPQRTGHSDSPGPYIRGDSSASSPSLLRDPSFPSTLSTPGITSDSIHTSSDHIHLRSDLGTSAPKLADRTAILRAQHGSSPSLFAPTGSSPASSSSSNDSSPTPATTAPGHTKFVFGTKPSSLKFERDPPKDAERPR